MEWMDIQVILSIHMIRMKVPHRKYFIVKIFLDSLACAKIKYILTIMRYRVRFVWKLFKRKIIVRNILDTKYSRFTIILFAKIFHFFSGDSGTEDDDQQKATTEEEEDGDREDGGEKEEGRGSGSAAATVEDEPGGGGGGGGEEEDSSEDEAMQVDTAAADDDDDVATATGPATKESSSEDSD